MKRFFMCCIVVIVALFLGFTAYYFIANKEKITLASDSASIKLNVGNTLNLNDIIKHDLPSQNTTIGVSFSVEGILSYDAETQVFTAEKVGHAVVTLTPSNTKFGPFVLNATVGDGQSAEFPYYIRTAAELAQIGQTGSNLTNAMSYELIADIYLTDMQWKPIALGAEFTGTFNGAGHVIYDMTITENYTHAGLFAKISKDAMVQGITFVNASISGDFTYAGTVVGENYGTVALCHVLESSITNGGSATGGIVGYSSFTQYENGGLSARIGMCGIEASSITGAGDVGGIVGTNKASVVENSYAVLDSVNGSSTAKFGGVVGNNMAYVGTFDKVSTIYKCYAYVKAVDACSTVGGIAGVNTDASTTVQNQFVYNLFVVDTDKFVGTETSAESTEVVKKSADALKNQSTYPTWDFNRVWKMAPDYAIIDFNSTYTTNVSDTVILPDEVYPNDPEIPGGNGGNNGGNGGNTGGSTGGGSGSTGGGSSSGGSSSGGSSSGGSTSGGSSSGSWNSGSTLPGGTQISLTASNFWSAINDMSKNPSSGKKYIFSTSFTVDLTSQDYNKLFPLGTKEKPFTCTVSPVSTEQITLKNLSVNGKAYASMFGYMGAGGAVSGLVFENANVTGTSSSFAGIVAADVQPSALVANCVVKNSTLSGGQSAGLFTGYNGGFIHNEKSENNTITNAGQANVGAIVGYNNAVITQSTSTSDKITTTAQANVGGITGYNAGSVSTSVVTSLTLTGKGNSTYAGGIAGQNTKTLLSSKITNSAVSASLSDSNTYIGGVTGMNSGSVSQTAVLGTNVVGYYAGGIAGINKSTISQSTSGQNHSGKVTGIYAGGLASINAQGADIRDCVVGTQMVTTEGSVQTCGFAYKLEADSLISHCFTYATFSGNNGYKNCDTDTPYQHIIHTAGGIWENTIGYKMGKIENSLMCNVSNVSIRAGNGIPFFDQFGKNELLVSEAEAKGEGNWERFYQAGYDFCIWKRASGQWFTLI